MTFGAFARPSAAALAGLLFAAVSLRLPYRSASPQDLRPKGAVRILAYVNGVFAAGDTVRCRAGDTLRLAVASGAPVHLAVFYRDAADGVLRAVMAGGPGRGSPRGERLPRALILDSDWERRWLYCVWSGRPFDAPTAEAYLEGARVAVEAASLLQDRTLVLLRVP
jgi:hypothetical protein